MLTIDKPKNISIDSEPPRLPPYLRGKDDRPNRRTIILPNISRIEAAQYYYSTENNWITIIYPWMDRIIGESIFDYISWQSTHISTRLYRQWLDAYQIKDGIPPHISFGGAIKSGEPDETFYPRWQEYARYMFI